MLTAIPLTLHFWVRLQSETSADYGPYTLLYCFAKIQFLKRFTAHRLL